MTSSRDLDEGGPRLDVASGPVAASTASGFRIGLKRRAEFQRASRGRRFNAKSLTLQAFLRPADDDGAARFGLTVTKRVGNAVERNRVKRRLRAMLRMQSLTPKLGHDYVIVARREVLTTTFAGVLADLTRTLDQARSGRAANRHGRPVKPDPSA